MESMNYTGSVVQYVPTVWIHLSKHDKNNSSFPVVPSLIKQKKLLAATIILRPAAVCYIAKQAHVTLH